MARKKNRTFGNGRNSTSTSFLMLDSYVFDCPAYRKLKPGPRCLLWELVRRHNGSNNGSIGLGVREAGDAIGVNKNAAGSYIHDLIESGFIAPNRPGGFNMKDPSSRRASEWRLTWIRAGNHSPTKEFMSVAKKSTVQETGTAGIEKVDSEDLEGPDCPQIVDLSARFSPAPRIEKVDTYISGHGHVTSDAGLGWWSNPKLASAQAALAFIVAGLQPANQSRARIAA